MIWLAKQGGCGKFEEIDGRSPGIHWVNHEIAGWNTVNNVSFGGVASKGINVFVTDMEISSDTDQGIVMIDANSGVSSRPVETNEYIDITRGQDGLFYALRNSYGDLDVIDPDSCTILRSVDLGHSSGSRAATANADGDIFMASWDNYVGHYTPEGVLINSLDLGVDLTDIDLAANGKLLVGSRFGSVFLTNEELSTAEEISIGSATTFATWVPAPPPGC